MTLIDYLVNKREFVYSEVAGESLGLGLGGIAPVLSGTYSNIDVKFILVNGLRDIMQAAAFAVFAKGVIMVDSLIMHDDNSTKFELGKQLLAHEVEHLKRGIVKPELSELVDLNAIGEIYLAEEQAINKKVAPYLYCEYDKIIRKFGRDFLTYDVGKQMIMGGIGALNQEKYISRLIELVSGTEFEPFVPAA